MKREKSKKAQEILKSGLDIYSFSKLDSYHVCKYQYFKSYIEKSKGIDNIYGILGGKMHDAIEDIYNDRATGKDLEDIVETMLVECDLMGITFPNESIADNWKANIRHFLANFNKMNLDVVTEEHVLYEISKDIWVQGYIDARTKTDKELGLGDLMNSDIIDWKTSSKFSKKDMPEKARQLIIYKLAKNAQGFNIGKVGWFMIKYIYVSFNGKKPKMCERRQWVKEMNKVSGAKKTMGKTFWEIELNKLGFDGFDVEFMIEDAIRNNDITKFPKELQDKITINDCMLWYDVTEDDEKDVIKFIEDTVHEILENGKDKNKYPPVKIADSQQFYCQNLCDHRKTCEYLKEYNKKQMENKEAENEEFDDLF